MITRKKIGFTQNLNSSPKMAIIFLFNLFNQTLNKDSNMELHMLTIFNNHSTIILDKLVNTIYKINDD